MSEQWKARISGLQAIAMWLLLLVVVGWLFFKPESTLNKDTIDKLSTSVDRISVAAENMGKMAADQREWAANLQQDLSERKRKRDNDYDDLYGKYGYDETANLTLNDIYAKRVQQSAEGVGRSDVHRNENGASKAQPGSSTTSKPEEQSNGRTK